MNKIVRTSGRHAASVLKALEQQEYGIEKTASVEEVVQEQKPDLTKVASVIASKRASQQFSRTSGVGESIVPVRAAIDNQAARSITHKASKHVADTLTSLGVKNATVASSQLGDFQTKLTGLFKKQAQVTYADIKVQIEHPALYGKVAEVIVTQDPSGMSMSDLQVDGHVFPVTTEGWIAMSKACNTLSVPTPSDVHLVIREYAKDYPEGMYRSLGLGKASAIETALRDARIVTARCHGSREYANAIEALPLNPGDDAVIRRVASTVCKVAADDNIVDEREKDEEDIATVGADNPADAQRKAEEVRRKNPNAAVTIQKDKTGKEEVLFKGSSIQKDAAGLIDCMVAGVRTRAAQLGYKFDPNLIKDKMAGQWDDYTEGGKLIPRVIKGAPESTDPIISAILADIPDPSLFESNFDFLTEQAAGIPQEFADEVEGRYDNPESFRFSSKQPGVPYSDGSNDSPTHNQGPAGTKVKVKGPGGDQGMWNNKKPTGTDAPENAGKVEQFLQDEKPSGGNESGGKGLDTHSFNPKTMPEPTKNQGPAGTDVEIKGPGGNQSMWNNKKPTSTDKPTDAGKVETWLNRERKGKGEQDGSVEQYQGREKPGGGDGSSKPMGTSKLPAKWLKLDDAQVHDAGKQPTLEDFQFPFDSAGRLITADRLPNRYSSLPDYLNENFSPDDIPDDAYDDESYAAECPVCGGEAYAMGVLGNRAHFRCQGCGSEFSGKVAGVFDNFSFQSPFNTQNYAKGNDRAFSQALRAFNKAREQVSKVRAYQQQAEQQAQAGREAEIRLFNEAAALGDKLQQSFPERVKYWEPETLKLYTSEDVNEGSDATLDAESAAAKAQGQAAPAAPAPAQAPQAPAPSPTSVGGRMVNPSGIGQAPVAPAPQGSIPGLDEAVQGAQQAAGAPAVQPQPQVNKRRRTKPPVAPQDAYGMDPYKQASVETPKADAYLAYMAQKTAQRSAGSSWRGRFLTPEENDAVRRNRSLYETVDRVSRNDLPPVYDRLRGEAEESIQDLSPEELAQVVADLPPGIRRKIELEALDFKTRLMEEGTRGAFEDDTLGEVTAALDAPDAEELQALYFKFLREQKLKRDQAIPASRQHLQELSQDAFDQDLPGEPPVAPYRFANRQVTAQQSVYDIIPPEDLEAFLAWLAAKQPRQDRLSRDRRERNQEFGHALQEVERPSSPREFSAQREEQDELEGYLIVYTLAGGEKVTPDRNNSVFPIQEALQRPKYFVIKDAHEAYARYEMWSSWSSMRSAFKEIALLSYPGLETLKSKENNDTIPREFSAQQDALYDKGYSGGTDVNSLLTWTIDKVAQDTVPLDEKVARLKRRANPLLVSQGLAVAFNPEVGVELVELGSGRPTGRVLMGPDEFSGGSVRMAQVYKAPDPKGEVNPVPKHETGSTPQEPPKNLPLNKRKVEDGGYPILGHAEGPEEDVQPLQGGPEGRKQVINWRKRQQPYEHGAA